MEKWSDSAANHRELYSLLMDAKNRFNQAISAATASQNFPDAPGLIAGRDIFTTTLNAITSDLFGGRLPLIGDFPERPTDAALLPPPILVALAYCIDSAQRFSLSHFALTCGQSRFDHVIINWPATLLGGLDEKARFFSDLVNLYRLDRNDELPLLSDPLTRAIQLLVIGRLLINIEIKQIGLPNHPRVLSL